MMKNTFKKLQLVLLITVIFMSCSKNEDNNIASQDFSKIERLVSFHGNRNASNVIINTQGGPVLELEDAELKEILKEASINNNTLVVNVHQAQTQRPNLFNRTDITFDKAKNYDLESVKTLKTVVDFFKKETNKKVYILGISFGAFMTQELIAQHGTDIADKFLISVGRLDIDEDTWKPFSRGIHTTYMYDSSGKYTIKETPRNGVSEKNMAKLAAGLGFNRYTQRLARYNDFSKITYVYGDRDEQVGPLSVREIKFLKDKGAKIILESQGDHDKAIKKTSAIMKQEFNL